ncbi:MAG: hypothetical protein IT287_03265 [Bdellovibrionaceae bacterium]|nr:hypothetical protein [Pseudobdellovibrionaceae bacterium]
MRLTIALFLMPLLLSCGKSAQDANNKNDNGISSTGSLQFKNFNGEFESVKSKDLLSLKVSASDPTSGTTIEKDYPASKFSDRLSDLGLSTPGKKDVTKLKITGRVVVIFLTNEGASITRTFNIFNYKYLQDTFFPDVIYVSKSNIDFDWLNE